MSKPSYKLKSGTIDAIRGYIREKGLSPSVIQETVFSAIQSNQVDKTALKAFQAINKTVLTDTTLDVLVCLVCLYGPNKVFNPVSMPDNLRLYGVLRRTK